jgi:hypothetical protein
MPMSEDQLDMITTMHNTMIRRLNALEVLHKGGQRAVDEFMSSSLTGMEKLKSAAISKAKRSSDNFNGPARKRNRRGGGRRRPRWGWQRWRRIRFRRRPKPWRQSEFRRSASIWNTMQKVQAFSLRRRTARAKVCNEIFVGEKGVHYQYNHYYYILV